MKYHFKIHRDKAAGFWAESLEPGLNANAQAKTLKELHYNMRESLDVALDEPEDSNWIPPMPDPSIKGRNVVEIPVDPKIAMATMVRVIRLRMGLTQKEVAARMGIKTLSTYQKLESSKTANPEWLTVVRLKQALPFFPLDIVAG